MGVKFQGWTLMSSKISNKAKQSILPKIRFPDFQDASEWDKKRLDDVARFVNDRLPLEKLSVTNYISTENILPNFRGITISAKLPTTKTATKFKENDILISNIRPYLKKIWLSNKDGGTSNDVIVLRSKETIVTNFLSSVLKSDTFINYVMKGAKGVKMPRGDLSLIKEYLIAYPFDKKEQQKIADCLSSIDELITAESKKLDALKSHKEGMMQQLFPAEGETVPKIRFPEFRKDGEWKNEKLEKYIEELRSRSSIQKEYEVLTSSRNGLVRQADYYDKSRLLERDNLGFNIIPPNYITYRSRSDNGLFFFNENTLGTTGIVSVYYPVFRMQGENNNVFFTSLFTFYAESIGKYSVGNAQKVLSLNELRKVVLPIPSFKEQEKISDCIISIDTMIRAQSEKIGALKTHKKGLMQQLFPTINEL